MAEKTWTKIDIFKAIILILLYVLLGNARSVQENPLIPGAIIAVNMIVPVLAGILFGKKMGFTVGILGTLLNALSPAGSLFEFAAILPHGIMGYIAGFLRKKAPIIISALSLFIGHVLNILMFILFSLVSFSIISSIQFWEGILYETFIGVISTTILATLYKLSFKEK